MYDVRRTYVVRCTSYNDRTTSYNVRVLNYIQILQCKLGSVEGKLLCTLYNNHCTLYNVHCTLYNVHCILYNNQCTLYNVHCTLYEYVYPCLLFMCESKLIRLMCIRCTFCWSAGQTLDIQGYPGEGVSGITMTPGYLRVLPWYFPYESILRTMYAVQCTPYTVRRTVYANFTAL